ncbi:MAG: sulfatase-like hydrolase/transferase [Verrucomicrobiae bacterium]|nr:sulfatase-like hydrolase/transferase [Verrucomicrobiae bacterium]
MFNCTQTHESGMWEEPPNRPHPIRAPSTDPNRVTVPPWLPNTPRVRTALARHYDNLAEADREFGERFRELQEDGLLDETVIVVWSDHGEGLPRAKRWPYDSGIRVPLIVRWPGVIQPGSVSYRLVSLIDLAPTMLAIAGVPVPTHLQGQSFLDGAEREYVFATRDRYDELYDMVRAVRDRRFKYIRNYQCELPYQLWIPYSYRHPAMQEIWQRALLGGAAERPVGLMQNQHPPEELYDLETDPHELVNVAGYARYEEVLTRLRRELDEWRSRFDRFGDVAETDMVRQWYPTGEQPQTAAPIFVPVGPDCLTGEPSRGGEFRGPLFVQLHCATQGASIGWSADSAWHLYTGPIRLECGTATTLRAKAIRIGYRESPEVHATFAVRH